MFVPKLQKMITSLPFWPQWTVRWMNSVSGPFTIFFYTPLIKWCISIANINDMRKPVELVNPVQQMVIVMSGTLFGRMCCLVTPVSYSLALGNLFMASTGVYQLYRKQQQQYQLQISRTVAMK